MAIESLSALIRASEGRSVFDAVLEADCTDRGGTAEGSMARMTALFAAIARAGGGYEPSLRWRRAAVARAVRFCARSLARSRRARSRSRASRIC